MAFCTFCGNEASGDAEFCQKCGKALKASTTSPTRGSSNPPAQPLQPPSMTAPTFQAPWGGALLLQSGESVASHWHADHEIAQLAIVNGRRQTVKQRIKGYLVLTTQRLAFVKERGVFGKSYHIDLTFPITDLGGLSMGGLVMKYVSISDSNGEHVFHVSGVGNETEFASFRSLIQEQLAKRQQAVEAEKRRDRIQITQDFGFLRDYMAKGGFRCRSSSARNA